MEKVSITVEAIINVPIHQVWQHWNAPEAIVQWNSASPDWHTAKVENDLRAGGTLNYRMEAKDGSMGFNFIGIYDQVFDNKLIEYTLGDGRKVRVEFLVIGDKTKVVETFDAEKENSIELQHRGWQAILNNFKTFSEAN